MPAVPISSQQKPHSLQVLLEQYNRVDHNKEGSIQITEIFHMLKEIHGLYLIDCRSILNKVILNNENSATFDQYLSILYQAELEVGMHRDPINYRMLQFLQLLEDYRYKCEQSCAYSEAEKAYEKAIQIKKKELKRWRRKLTIQKETKIASTSQDHHKNTLQFDLAWDSYLEQYEASVLEALEQLKTKHQIQIQEQEQRIKNYYQSRNNASKKLLDLRYKQRVFVRQKQYADAQKVKKAADKLEKIQKEKHDYDFEKAVLKRRDALKKHQTATLAAQLKRIEADRNQKLKQRQLDSKLIVSRLRNIEEQFIHKQNHRIKETIQNLKQTMCFTKSAYRTKKVNSLPKFSKKHGYQDSSKIRVNSYCSIKGNHENVYDP